MEAMDCKVTCKEIGPGRMGFEHRGCSSCPSPGGARFGSGFRGVDRFAGPRTSLVVELVVDRASDEKPIRSASAAAPSAPTELAEHRFGRALVGLLHRKLGFLTVGAIHPDLLFALEQRVVRADEAPRTPPSEHG